MTNQIDITDLELGPTLVPGEAPTGPIPTENIQERYSHVVTSKEHRSKKGQMDFCSSSMCPTVADEDSTKQGNIIEPEMVS